MIGRAFLASLLALQVPLAPAAAREACDPPRGVMQSGESWAQKRLDPRRVWSLSTGAGVRVAIIDSGVDLQHPQIRLAGRADLTGTGYRDCLGHGTAVAGIIGAQYMQGVLFYGMAPGARLLSYKQTNAERSDGLDLLVRAIKSAADQGSKVINVSIATSDQPALKAAVEYALAKDVVIVAAAGNVKDEDGTPLPDYPASYEGVLAVGAAGPNGLLSEFSNPKSSVAVLGPGQGVTSTWPGGSYYKDLKGTSYAAPYVSGVAALVRARFPTLDQAQVRQRIIATADGATGVGKGAGMVNPMQAVSAVLPFEPAGAPVVAPPPASPLPPGTVAKAPPVDRDAIDLALIIAGSALGLALLVAVARVMIPMGRRRGWRPGQAE
ncbi:S8 family serine peptidase [Nonomuraea turcica]|uniref:S8 family serine peptidase n=1 Tax=Nonomuraea sp. G32 TaxID=3067274 RepID=UPI00273BCDBA|nr:S8 family serine peptidase [Nonomuraea sp. G32]MDP4506615.1 S8 family serine peptidase [Nonomuraea sp. G32]